MSQLVKSKSQMGGTLVSAFYERSEEDNDNGEILSIAHAVEVTPEYQPLKPYSKEFRNRVDDISKRRQFKDEAFNGKNTIEDRMRRRKEAEKVGYSEAKQLYEKKLKSLRDKLEQEKENASRQLKDYANLISKILAEIEDNDLLFLLKSFDLDLRMNYPLGTVFGYGMAD